MRYSLQNGILKPKKNEWLEAIIGTLAIGIFVVVGIYLSY